MLKFVWEGDVSSMTVDNVKSFVSDFKAGNLKPHLKSAARPEADTVDGLTTLVGSSFEELVNDASKDVLVKYYAPWCGHCKALAPVWDELAKDTEGIEDLLIAKFDATENEVAGLDIRGYPTLKSTLRITRLVLTTAVTVPLMTSRSGSARTQAHTRLLPLPSKMSSERAISQKSHINNTKIE